MRSWLGVSFVLVLAACSSGASDPFEAIRPRQPAFCTEACLAARAGTSCANWDDPVLDDAHIQDCIDEMACRSDPELACGATPSSTYDFDCYVGCVMMESQAVQDVVLENLRCTYPPDVCH